MNFEKNITPPDSGMTKEKAAAIQFSAIKGEELKQILPEIVEDYRSGMTLEAIVDARGIIEKLGIQNHSHSTARVAIQNALKGYNGNFYKAYAGLIPEEEFEKISKEHRKTARLKNVAEQKTKGRGIFGMPKERRQEIGSKQGKRSFLEKTGPHGLTHEERREISRRAQIAKGVVPFPSDERVEILKLTGNPNYVWPDGRIKLQKIAEEMNLQFHQGELVRNAGSISRFLQFVKKRYK